jgi:hypothetical protein
MSPDVSDPCVPLTEFLAQLGMQEIRHTEKTYLDHLAAVYRGLESWGCAPEVCAAGMFHSIYGTEMFRGFTLPFDRRADIARLIGERAERLAYANCAMDRTSFDQAVLQPSGPYRFRNRWSDETIELGEDDFGELCRIHLCDWLEQVPRSKKWKYRREAYGRLAARLGPWAEEAYRKVYSAETPRT